MLHIFISLFFGVSKILGLFRIKDEWPLWSYVFWNHVLIFISHILPIQQTNWFWFLIGVSTWSCAHTGNYVYEHSILRKYSKWYLMIIKEGKATISNQLHCRDIIPLHRKTEIWLVQIAVSYFILFRKSIFDNHKML